MKYRKLTEEEVTMLNDELTFLEKHTTAEDWIDQVEILVDHLRAFKIPKDQAGPLKNDLKRYKKRLGKLKSRKRITPSQFRSKMMEIAAPVLERLEKIIDILSSRYRK